MGTNYVKKARTVRLPAVTNMQINSFSSGVVDVYGSYIYNGTILQYPDESFYVTQRPSFAVFDSPANATTPVTDLRGRGIFYWAQVSSLYFVNDGIVYKGTYNTEVTTTPVAITGGSWAAGTATITSVAHGLVVGDGVTIKNVTPSGYNGNYKVLTADANTITYALSADPGGAWSSGGTTQLGLPPGTNKVLIAELGDVIVFIDAENNASFYVNSSAATTLVSMNDSTDPNFDALPQNNSKELAYGIVVLDQTMYVLATDGTIWNCDTALPLDWSDTGFFTTAEKEEDSGVFIAKHYDHVVIFGRRTIEFFYNAGNATGSPLSTRQDISHNIGCADPNSVWRNGDDIYFLGIDTSGQIQPYLLREYQPVPLTNTSIASFLTTTKSIDSIRTIGSGMSSGGITYYLLTIYTLDDTTSNVDSSATYVYNSTTNTWTEWEFAGTAIDNLPLVGYTITDDSRIGEGILSSGELLYAVDNYTPYDTEDDGTDPYVVSGYVGSDYVLEGTLASTNVITMKVRLDNFDNDSRDWKFAHQIRYVGDATTDSNLFTIRWNDSYNVPTYTGTRTIDLQSNTNKLTRLGRFKSRSFECEYSGTEQIRFKGLDLDITEGTH